MSTPSVLGVCLFSLELNRAKYLEVFPILSVYYRLYSDISLQLSISEYLLLTVFGCDI